jgi:hypothetical protein
MTMMREPSGCGRAILRPRHRERWRSAAALAIACLASCQPSATPAPAPALAEPADFAAWPRVTERPIRVTPQLAAMCAVMPAGDTASRHRDPHAGHAIVVRVSPDAEAAYREGRPLPAGAVVVKEKYDDASASGPLRAYGVMMKRAAGYAPRDGDWEYAYVALDPERTVTRGPLAECSGCHARARGRDFLFRSYGQAGR